MRDVYLIGIGQTPVDKDAEDRARHRAATAVREALADAGVEGDRVDSLLVGNMTGGVLGRQQQLGALIADYAGLSGIDAMTVEAACASGAAATRMAYLTIAGGIHDIVVVCGMERMTHADKRSVTEALATAADWELEGRHGESFISLNAKLMRLYMQRYGVGAEPFAAFSINAHKNAIGNPNALFHKRIDINDYLQSKSIIDPIRLYDVSPVCNGAAAIVLASDRVAAELTRARAARVRLAASAAATAPVALSRRPDPLKLDAIAAATERALGDAGVDRGDVDLFELHDAYSIMSVLTLESAGFTRPGTATCFGAEGRIAIDGDLPVSSMGGLKARGHPVGATGVYQLIEAYLQLSGAAGPTQIADPEIALVQNIGGTASTVVNHVLMRVA